MVDKSGKWTRQEKFGRLDLKFFNSKELQAGAKGPEEMSCSKRVRGSFANLCVFHGGLCVEKLPLGLGSRRSQLFVPCFYHVFVFSRATFVILKWKSKDRR